MPQCKDRLRYRWLGFHLDLTTSARLRNAATPARRARSKRRRPRKQDDPRVDTFNLLFALGLVPTKSRMNDPQGLLLNRMHVMDGDCPKSEVIGEKAPELGLSASTKSLPLAAANNGVTTTVTTDISDEADALTVTNTAIFNNNNNNINSTKDKDVINNFSAETDHIQQSQLYLSTKECNNANVLLDNVVVVNNINESIATVDEKKKKINGEFNNVDQKNEIVDTFINNVDNSEIIDDSKIFDDKMAGNNDNGCSTNKLVNGNKDDNINNESSDGNCAAGDGSCENIDKSNGIVQDDSSSIEMKCVAIDEDIENEDVLLEEEEEGDEEVEEDEDAEVEKAVEDEMLGVNEPEEMLEKLEDLKDDVSSEKHVPQKILMDEDKSIPPQDVPLSLKKEDTSMDAVSESSAVNSSPVSVVPSIVKPVVAKEESCVTGNNVSNVSGLCNEEEDRNSVTSSQSRKRTVGERERREVAGGGEGEAYNEAEGENEGEGSSSESENGTKRQRVVMEAEDERERLVREYVERCTQSVEEMSRNADKLQRDIGALSELARAKELEWNSILRLRKLKEEMLERLLRRRRQAMMLADNGLTQDWAADYTKPKINKNLNTYNSHNQLMMVPVVSSSPGNLPTSLSTGVNSRPILSSPDTTRTISRMQQRPILPKPLISQNHLNPGSLLDQQNTVIGEGRQGPILDVKSIIADYRSRHPENVPRRGRRMKSPMVSSTRISGSPALMSMANMALCSGAHIRNTSQDCSSVQDNSRPSSTDSTRSTHQTDLPAPGLSFKDVLVQFAKMSQPPPTAPPPIKQPPPPPPPYPEVTLHPVPAPQSPPPTHSSLLHGILTKSTAAPSPTSTANHRPTTFSPTLARLLTAPERDRTPMMTSQFRPPTSRVSISDLLTSSKKTRNEITITPVSSQSPVKSKDEVVLLDDDEETDSTDRLVIDESAEREREGNGNGDVNNDDVPECQGCHQRAALFVCAGCGNQWYCSRECQVTAWEEHCETCSG